VLFGEAPVVRFDAVANKFARLAGVRKPLTIYGEGGQKRPFLHVRDASNAIASVLDAPGTFGSHTLNVVGTNASILDLAETIQEAEPETDIRHTDQDIRTHLSFEISGAAIARLGWTPSESLHSGLSELLDRFRGFEPSHLSKRGDLEL
jgi:nucleoside-diphosphate-sugar epimerase